MTYILCSLCMVIPMLYVYIGVVRHVLNLVKNILCLLVFKQLKFFGSARSKFARSKWRLCLKYFNDFFSNKERCQRLKNQDSENDHNHKWSQVMRVTVKMPSKCHYLYIGHWGRIGSEGHLCDFPIFFHGKLLVLKTWTFSQHI